MDTQTMPRTETAANPLDTLPRIDRLSAAMRAGCMLSRPTRNRYIDWQTEAVYACAMGAALIGADPSLIARWEATYSDDGEDKWSAISTRVQALFRQFGLHTDQPVSLPETGPVIALYDGPTKLLDTILMLNDTVGMPREKIADWLEQIGL